MQRRTAAVILVLAGLLLIVEPLADRLFTRTEPFEAMTNDFRPVMRPEVIATFRQDLRTIEGLPAAVNNNLIPAFAAQANVPPQQFAQLLATQYPKITGGLQAIGQIAPRLDATLTAMDAQRADFAKADSIPTNSQSTKSVPWAILIAGLVALIAGVAMLGPGRFVPAVATVLGALLIGVPLLISMPAKAAGADRLNASNRALLTTTNADSLRQALATFQEMGTEFQTNLIPGLAAQFKITPAQVLANPVVSAIATSLPAGLERMQTFSVLIDENVPRYDAIKPVSFRRVTWVVVYAGIATLLAGLLGLTAAESKAILREHRIRRMLGRGSKEAAA